MPTYQSKRIYEADSQEDGLRVLVDRLWPRGVSKEQAALDHWMKEIAPSNELRIAFHAGELSFEDFAKLYRAELADNAAVAELRALAAKAETVTLLYGARNEEENHALVLKAHLEQSA